MSRTEKPVGVGGWLLFLIVMMILIGPLISVLGTFIDFALIDVQFPELANLPVWVTFKYSCFIVLACAVGVSVYGGWALATKRDSSVVTVATATLWIAGPVAAALTAFVIPKVTFEWVNPDPSTSGRFIGIVMWAAFWSVYLKNSTRVWNTYQIATTASAKTPIRTDISNTPSTELARPHVSSPSVSRDGQTGHDVDSDWALLVEHTPEFLDFLDYLSIYGAEGQNLYKQRAVERAKEMKPHKIAIDVEKEIQEGLRFTKDEAVHNAYLELWRSSRDAAGELRRLAEILGPRLALDETLDRLRAKYRPPNSDSHFLG